MLVAAIAVDIMNSGTGAATLSVAGIKATGAITWKTDKSNDITEVSVTAGTGGTCPGLSR